MILGLFVCVCVLLQSYGSPSFYLLDIMFGYKLTLW